MSNQNFIGNFISEESGQGITEYGAILAFVAVLVSIVFGFVTGGLKQAIQNAFSTVSSQLNNLDATASTT